MNAVDEPTSARILLITASVRSGRFGPTVARWAEKILAEVDAEFEVVDLDGMSFPSSMEAHADSSAFAEAVGRADAVLVVTPEYNHSFPGPLKSAIDSVGGQWRAKPVAFISYGGMAGGLRAVEALRLVFAELHTVTVRDTVSLHNPWGPAGDPAVEYPDAQATEALHRMLRQLLWWAEALRMARDRAPYPAG